MKTFKIAKSKDCTKDGAYIYDLSEVPQDHCYIKMRNMFARKESQVYDQVASIIESTDFKIEFV
jgi:hypothetical protein